MEDINETVKKELLDAAKGICANSYSPYSNFPVGAAVLTSKNEIFTGTNIENASYSLTICAERIAMGNAVSHSKNSIKAIAIFSPKTDITPCGACRQFIQEFGNDILVIYLVNNTVVTKRIKELLPTAFTKEDLK
jgi:cytidine deaminase